MYFIYQFNSPEDISILWKNLYARSLYTKSVEIITDLVI